MTEATQTDQETVQQTWDQFVQICRSCQRCPLAKSRRNVVISRGAIQAPLMFIGEGPGADEDRTGIPFVGAAGRLLDLLLTAYDLGPESYHIGNIVKCRPPNNRVPSPEEAKACRPLLAKQFQIVQPRIIVLLGGTAYKYFTGGREGITKIRGQWIEKGGYLILPTYHPAYILRNNNERVRLWDDIGKARAKMEELGFLKPLVHQPPMPQGRG